MQVPSREEITRDMMEWWDKLQANKPPPPVRQPIQVEIKDYRFKEGEEPPKIIIPSTQTTKLYQ